MSEQRAFELESPGSFDDVLHGVVQWPEGPGPHPAVVICHGFKGFYEWGFFPPLADLLTDRGFVVVRFNYSGSGMRPGDERVTDLDAFRRNTLSLERDETLKVLDSVHILAQGRAAADGLTLLGHSRGGAAAILAAAHPEWRGRLRALVTWAALSSFDRYTTPDARAAWRRDGVIPIVNGRTGQELELGIELLEDVEQHAASLDLGAAAEAIEAPWLIVHGAADETVPPSEAHTLDRRASSLHELQIVKGGSHTFGAQHPFAGPTRELIRAMNGTQIWLRRHTR
ncbi:MAG: alpha/beta fold hydrolase [Acidobacteriota bacterium]